MLPRERREQAKTRRAAGALLGTSPHILSDADSNALQHAESAATLWEFGCPFLPPEALEADDGGPPADVAQQAEQLSLQLGAAATPAPIALLDGGDTPLAERLRARSAFVSAKKAPQIRWLLALLQRLLPRLPPHPLIVDCCGGRGSLALIVARAVPAATVVCLDSSSDAVIAGAAAVSADPKLCNLRFIHASLPLERRAVLDLLGGAPPSMLLGLHACGGLSDAVLAMARDFHGAAFLLVPCCATKFPQLRPASDDAAAAAEATLLCRLAESPDRAVCVRSMRVLNSRRLALMAGGGRSEGGLDLYLTEMPAAWSARNQVLVGAPAAGIVLL